MTNTMRRIKVASREEAKTEHAHLMARLARGVTYDKIGYRIHELERDISAYTAELEAV
jgi:hypothetical protein